jgi:hypothetical protein
MQIKANRNLLLLLSIFVFAFIYRFLLMTRVTFPSGADIGLHNSVIYSILSRGETNFLYNYFQMGGGLSLTFPGYHIFASYIILLTGIPDYLVHTLIVTLISSLIVLCSYLITRAVWRESAALVVAFLVAISRFDIEMLLWGGYPNVITLLLIPLVLYLFLQRKRFTRAPFLVSTSLLCGSIFLTHTLSTLVFVSLVSAMVFLGAIFSKRVGVTRRDVLSLLLPLVLGGALFSPFLAVAVPAYLSNPDAADIQQALVSTRILPLEIILPLFGCVTLFFLLSKKYHKRFISFSSLLLVLWILVPVVFTQGYLVGFYIDYNRFLYFVVMPVFILIGLFVDHGAGFFAQVIDNYRAWSSQVNPKKQIAYKRSSKVARCMTRKNLYSAFIVGFLLFAFFAVPIFATPEKSVGIDVQKFYQLMNDPRYEAIQWSKQNTPSDAVFVSDAYYGWWFSGFAQRPTWSAVDPQYLSLSRELQPAFVARNLLDTDYLVDNGYIQLREDGGYLARHNPEILAKLNWTYFPYSFFNFNSNASRILYRVNGNTQITYFDSLSVKNMQMENDTAHATIIIERGNEFLNCTQLITTYKQVQYVNVTTVVESALSNVSLDWAYIRVQSKGRIIPSVEKNTVGLIDEGVKTFGQIIFTKEQPIVDPVLYTNPCIFELVYNLSNDKGRNLQFSVSAFSLTNDPAYYVSEEVENQKFAPLITEKIGNYAVPLETELPLQIFNYKAEIELNNISFIVNREFSIRPKFSKDPAFDLVFINNDVAIFKVRASIN